MMIKKFFKALTTVINKSVANKCLFTLVFLLVPPVLAILLVRYFTSNNVILGITVPVAFITYFTLINLIIHIKEMTKY